jgi:dual specificity protein phosphatase 1B
MILPKLFLGSYADATAGAADLAAHGVTHVLNAAAEECPEVLDGFEPMLLTLRDDSDENTARYFTPCTQFIHGALESGGAVLVHCRMGVSRSATIVLAYLMQYGTSPLQHPTTMPYLRAFDYVKGLRPQVSPNLGFVLALHELDDQIQKGIAVGKRTRTGSTSTDSSQGETLSKKPSSNTEEDTAYSEMRGRSYLIEKINEESMDGSEPALTTSPYICL